MATLLPIEYEYEYEYEASPETESKLPLDFSEVTVPEGLLFHLKEAAENYRTTQLKRYLNEVEQIGGAGGQLSKYLQPLLQNYDMESILNVLSEIKRA